MEIDIMIVDNDNEYIDKNKGEREKMEMNKIVQVKEYNAIIKVSEFEKLPKNEVIKVNGYLIEILSNNDDNIYYGVRFIWDNNKNEIMNIEDALRILRITREVIFINDIYDIDKAIKNSGERTNKDKKYILNITNYNNSKNKDMSKANEVSEANEVNEEECNISFEFYRTFSENRGSINTIEINPLICILSINKEVYIESDNDNDEGFRYNENREYYFNIYSNEMIPYDHIFFKELSIEDEEIIREIFKDMSKYFNRRYVFSRYGDPVEVIEK